MSSITESLRRVRYVICEVSERVSHDPALVTTAQRHNGNVGLHIGNRCETFRIVREITNRLASI
jgi:hypothetical protein